MVDGIARLAVRQRVGDEVFEEVFRKVHVVLEVCKGHLRETRETKGDEGPKTGSCRRKEGDKKQDGLVVRSSPLPSKHSYAMKEAPRSEGGPAKKNWHTHAIHQNYGHLCPNTQTKLTDSTTNIKKNHGHTHVHIRGHISHKKTPKSLRNVKTHSNTLKPWISTQTPPNTQTLIPHKQQTKIMDTHPPYLGFDHPELREVSRSVTVLRPEGGSEGVNVP